MGYADYGLWHYTPDPAMDYWDKKRRKEAEERQTAVYAEKYTSERKLLKSEGFQTVEELLKAYHDLQKKAEHDAEYIDALRREIMSLANT